MTNQSERMEEKRPVDVDAELRDLNEKIALTEARAALFEAQARVAEAVLRRRQATLEFAKLEDKSADSEVI